MLIMSSDSVVNILTPHKKFCLICHTVCCGLYPAAISPSMHQKYVPDH